MTGAQEARLRDPRVLLVLLLVIYVGASVVTLAVWAAKGVYTVTGDEPHYLVMADGVIRHFSLELSLPYAQEFATREIFSSGLAPAGTLPESPFAHVLAGPHGLFSWHGPGVSFLVAPAFLLLGVLGAKLVMVALGALVVIVAWRVAAVFIADPVIRFATVLVVAIAYPLVPASTQIYPDLVAGLLALSGVYYLLTVDRPRRLWSLAGYSFVVGYLPWLGTKFVVTAGLLIVAMLAWTWRGSRSARALVALAVPAAVLLTLLVVFNVYAFGRISGPPAEGALEVSRTSLMVVWGLLLDQDQGILLQNPVLWLAVFGLVPMVRRIRWVALVWLLVFASIWLPGGMHTGWYGLGSFVGRYSWALAVLAILPGVVGLAWLAEHARRLFWIVVAVGSAVHLAFFGLTTLIGGTAPGLPSGLDLYTKPPDTWLESYALFYFPGQNWLPALYNDTWAYSFWPNMVWLVLLLLVALVGWRPRAWRVVVPIGVVSVAIAGLVGVPGPRTQIQNVDVAGASEPAYLSSGPVRQMRQGTYLWSVDYSAEAQVGAVAGKWELVSTATNEVAAAGELPGTSGAVQRTEVPLPFLSLQPKEYVLRVATYGTSPMRILRTAVRHS